MRAEIARVSGKVIARALAVVLGFSIGLFSPPPIQAAESGKALLRALHESWVYLDAGNLREAEAGFERARDLPGGKESAELQYGLSLIPWKRGLARQSYWQLQTALTASRSGDKEGEDWRHRIHGRIRYIERNFSAVTLRHPGRGRPLPLLLDPPPRDPVLQRFVATAVELMDQGTTSADGAQRLFLPSGGYWVGDKHRELIAGEVQPGQQQVIYLPVASGPVLKRYKDRLRTQRDGQRIPFPDDARKADHVEADSRQKWGEMAQPDSSGPPPPAALEYPVVRSYLTDRTSYEISKGWTQVPFHVRYSVYCPDRDAEHRFEFPEYEFYVRFDPGGELRVKGAELLRVSLGSDWLSGEEAGFNEVELIFDGTTLLVIVNGIEFGPVKVRSVAPPRPGSWSIRMSDDRARIRYLLVRPL